MSRNDLIPAIKDTSHSCVFDFPDNPPDPIPPPPGHGSPPGCYPYCSIDDWPPPFPVPPPHPGLPPNAVPHGIGRLRGNFTMDGLAINSPPDGIFLNANLEVIVQGVDSYTDSDFATVRNEQKFIVIGSTTETAIAYLLSSTFGGTGWPPGQGPSYERANVFDSVNLLDQFPVPESFITTFNGSQTQVVPPSFEYARKGRLFVSFFLYDEDDNPVKSITYPTTNLRIYTALLSIYTFRDNFSASILVVNGVQLTPTIIVF